jgi:hypothetical protein
MLVEDATRSRPLYNRGGSGGLGGNWMDSSAGQGTGENPVDGFRHLAKVRVAGSNPVFRSKNSGPELEGTEGGPGVAVAGAGRRRMMMWLTTG